jgi:MoaA/NifB/PqqE/SkfB family radical SAM enzyme
MNLRKMTPAPVARAIRKHVLRRPPRVFHLEVHLTDHCNLNCKGCAHFSSISEPNFTDVAQFDADFKRLAELIDFERIHLLGGEPLLHPDVAEFVRIARRYFPNTELALVTNGTLVVRMKEPFWTALRETGCELLVDDYPVKLPKDEINRLGAKHGVNLCWTHARTDFFKLPIVPEGGLNPEESFRACKGFNNCPILKDGRIYPCAYTAYADIFTKKFDVDGLEVTEADSISIYDETDPYVVAEFLMRPVPWCTHCDAKSLEYFDWERGAGDSSEWLKAT